MKKKMLSAIFILFGLWGMIYAQVVTVTSPNSKAKWKLGKSYSICWTTRGFHDAEVKILLYNADTKNKVLLIEAETTDDGEYKWEIPANLTPKKYFIVVKVINQNYYDRSDDFDIISRINTKTDKRSPGQKDVKKDESITEAIEKMPDLQVPEAKIEDSDKRWLVYKIMNTNWRKAKLDVNEKRLCVQLYALSERAVVVCLSEYQIDQLNTRGYTSGRFVWEFTVDTKITVDFNDVVEEFNEGNNWFLFEQ